MSEVKRYEFVYENDFGNEYPAFPLLEVDGDYVEFADFDRVTAERDAALGREAELRESIVEFRDREVSLRESLGKARYRLGEVLDERDALQQRLTAADERSASAIALVTRLIECAGGQPSIATGYLRDIMDVLKPAEGLDRRDMAARVHLMRREGCGDDHDQRRPDALEKRLSAYTKQHHPVEFGPSDSRRIGCSCGHPDPHHGAAKQ